MPELSVFITKQDNATLTKLVESLRQDATGYSPGLAVTPDTKIPGLYRLETHRGEITDAVHPVRIISNKIIAKSEASRIEDILRTAKVPFKRYDRIDIPDPLANPLDISLSDRQPNLIYNPQ